ncbi:unnamed protein product [Lota lota]
MCTTRCMIQTNHCFLSLTARFVSHRRLLNVRALTLTPETMGKPQEKTDEVNDEPIKFSTSKGSHRSWKVDRTMGSQYQRPWWKVLPVSVIGVGFLLWCAFREETDVDVMLQKDLYEHLPGLLSDEEDEQPPEE